MNCKAGDFATCTSRISNTYTALIIFTDDCGTSSGLTNGFDNNILLAFKTKINFTASAGKTITALPVQISPLE